MTLRVDKLGNRSETRSEVSHSSAVPAHKRPNAILVMHGHNEQARRTIFALLRAAELKPLEFEQARHLTGQASPYIGDILSAAFAYAQAIIVLLTDDERVEPRPELLGPREEADQGFQPRPNIILEAEMALGINSNRTVIVEIGDLRQISNLTG